MYITWLSIASTVSVRSQSLRMKCMIENLGAPGSLHIIQKWVISICNILTYLWLAK